MFLRMLAIACLVLAFAHPVPEESLSDQYEQQLVSIYVDNSFSMGLQGDDGELLGIARKRVEEIVEGYGEEAQFNLVTNSSQDFNTDFYEKTVFLDEIEQIQLTPELIAPADLYRLQANSLLKLNGNRNIVWISDFQESLFEFDELKTDSAISFYLIPLLAEDVANVNIDSAWFEQSFFEKGQNANLKVRISNLGDREVKGRSVFVAVNGVQRALQNTDLDPGEQEELDVNFAVSDEGWNLVKVSVEDYPIEFDNDFFTGFYVETDHPVLCINGGDANPYLEKVYQTSENFSFSQLPLNQIGSERLGEYKLIILNEPKSLSSGVADQLTDFVAGGGNLLIIPAEDADVRSYNRLTAKAGFTYGAVDDVQSQIKNLELENLFFNDIFESIPNNTNYPIVKKHYLIEPNSRSAMVSLMELANGHRFLVESSFGGGKIFSLAIGLGQDWSALQKNALFVPLMYKFATYQGVQDAIGDFINDRSGEIIIGDVAPGKVLSFDNDNNPVVPDQNFRNNRLQYSKDDLSQPGFYSIQEVDEDSVLAYVGLNYERRESDMSFPALETIEESLANSQARVIDSNEQFLTGTFRDLNDQNRWWRYFLIAALCFIIFEIIAIKLPFR